MSKKDKKLKSGSKEWTDALIFAIIAATLIRWAAFEAFTIPTSSMEKSLLVGDYLFVSKVHYGPRTPKTILQLPLTHQTIWGTQIPSFLDWVQLKSHRIPGFTSVKNNDVVVFNYPAEKGFPSDMKLNYIKRCIAIAGDTLQIKDQEVFINGKRAETPSESQTQYTIVSKTQIGKRTLEKYNVYAYDYNNIAHYRLNMVPGPEGKFTYTAMLPKHSADDLRKLDFIESVDRIYAREDNDVFPQKASNNWSIDNFGPLYIPKEGDVVKITADNWSQYKAITEEYEVDYNDGKIGTFKDGKFYLGDEVQESYTVKQNYYFMMGDNRHNSLDSRYWGYVPFDHVIGKAVMVWMSKDNNPDAENSIRYDRIGLLIGSDTQIPSWIKIVIGILLLAFFGYFSFVKKKDEDNNQIK
ncbi:signal peptidase I [Flammeovirga pectinis]|uniref:Signal peptidase I n=1 Tax=Flammeovirga pectinis TaxID=2494373 RepID=A0A3Q9FLS8_9BACT|nr:signal peptidase I [Flammeovirga pectinis]AZQ63037.1 signal peptidase I [Flammeovirga pectinis]